MSETLTPPSAHYTLPPWSAYCPSYIKEPRKVYLSIMRNYPDRYYSLRWHDGHGWSTYGGHRDDSYLFPRFTTITKAKAYAIHHGGLAVRYKQGMSPEDFEKAGATALTIGTDEASAATQGVHSNA